MTHPNPPAALADDLRQLTALELSLPSQLRYVVLLLAAFAMTTVVTSLLITEPRLPLRTSLALGVMTVIGLSWTSFAAWVLTRKRVLLSNHRIVAARLAVVFSTVFAVGALAIGISTAKASPFAAATVGTVMLGVAVTMLARARRQFARLSQRRDELQRQLDRQGR